MQRRLSDRRQDLRLCGLALHHYVGAVNAELSSERSKKELRAVEGEMQSGGGYFLLVAPLIMGVSIELWCQLLDPVVV